MEAQTTTLPTIDDLYTAHRRGSMPSHDHRWGMVDRILHKASMTAVAKAASKYNIPDSTHSELILGVKQRLIITFIRKKAKPKASLSLMIPSIGFRAVISELRKKREVMSVSHGIMDETIVGDRDVAAPAADDHHEEIRRRLPPARFRQYGPARDILLAHMSMAGDLPGSRVLKTVVPDEIVDAVYNSSIVDINTAIEHLEV